jgi:hypothetical protein
MNDKNKKVVNTEEQNRAINPNDRDYKEDTSSQEPLVNNDNIKKSETNPETENPEGGSEVETPHRIEGDDAGSIERKIPNL